MGIPHRRQGATQPAEDWLSSRWAGLIIATGMYKRRLRVSDPHAVDPARAVMVWATLDAVQKVWASETRLSVASGC